MSSILIMLVATWASAPGDAPETLLGKWEILRAKSNGRETKKVVGATLTLDDNKATITPRKDRLFLPGAILETELHFPAPAPAKKEIIPIDFLMKDENGKVYPMRGIATLDGDKLTLCFGTIDADRPKVFATKIGDEVTLWALKRLRKTPE